MQDLRYINLFRKITGIRTRFCFTYNNVIIFSVPKQLIRKAIGPEGSNVKRINEIIKKRIKIIPIPKGLYHVRPFIEAVVSPIKFKDLEVKGNEVILSAGKQSKAALIGRDKRRLMEMKEIVKDFFGKEFRIVWAKF